MLNRHLNENHEPICPICSQKYQNFKNMKAHLRLYHSEDSVITCDICGKICKNKNAYAQHNYHVHKRGQQLKCNICGRICVNRTRLVRHTRACLINNPDQLPWTNSEEFDEVKKVPTTFNDSIDDSMGIDVPDIEDEKEIFSEKLEGQTRKISKNTDLTTKLVENSSKELQFLSEKEVSLDLDNSPPIPKNDLDNIDQPDIIPIENTSKENLINSEQVNDDRNEKVPNNIDDETEDTDDFTKSLEITKPKKKSFLLLIISQTSLRERSFL